MNGKVLVLPKITRPSAGNGPEAANPTIEPGASKDPAVRMVVKDDTEIDSGGPSKHRACCENKTRLRRQACSFMKRNLFDAGDQMRGQKNDK
jgi:hypothetical protein